jgi:hypothetical protein
MTQIYQRHRGDVCRKSPTIEHRVVIRLNNSPPPLDDDEPKESGWLKFTAALRARVDPYVLQWLSRPGRPVVASYHEQWAFLFRQVARTPFGANCEVAGGSGINLSFVRVPDHPPGTDERHIRG